MYLAPLAIYLIMGVCFLVVGFFNLWRIRSLMQKHHPGADNTSKMTQLMSKIGIFSVLYIVPAIFVLMVLSYEQHYRPLWEQSQLCNCAEQFDQQGDNHYSNPWNSFSTFILLTNTFCISSSNFKKNACKNN